AETRSLVRMALKAAGHRIVESDGYAQAQLLLSNALAPDLLLVEPSATNSSDAALYREFLKNAPLDSTYILIGAEEKGLREQASSLGIKHFLTAPLVRNELELVIESFSEPIARETRSDIAYPSVETAGGKAAIPADMPALPHLEELGENQFFLAASPSMLNIYRQVKLLADSDVPVLILGESGTGKEVIAHLIHKHSQRSRHKFLKVNCAALPADLLESELFGHQRGAFTGAIKDRAGKFEQANHGTLLLDEIGEMSAQMQAKILHVLQDGQFTRLGAQESSKVDVRVLAATNVHMESALQEKTFREDLYYRLSVFTISIPPLRERREEIPYLIEETIRRSPAEMKSGCECNFSSRLMDAALLYDWRGNLRELRNFVTRTIIMRDPDAAVRELDAKIGTAAEVVQRDDQVCAPLPCSGMRTIMRDVKDRTEAQLILDALEVSGWNRRHAAQYLNISYRGLLYKIQQHRLTPRLPRDLNEASRIAHSLRGNLT
ncbi:MAG: sigma-54 dependent transcriptional regulator, partial [Terracidiphilus sp.]